MIDYMELEKEFKQIDSERTEIKSRLKELDFQLKELRKKEVYNVLDYIASRARWEQPTKELLHEIECYAVHCLNCINGNIDGTFLPIWQQKQKNGGYKVMYGGKYEKEA